MEIFHCYVYQRVTVAFDEGWKSLRFLPGISFCCATLRGLKLNSNSTILPCPKCRFVWDGVAFLGDPQGVFLTQGVKQRFCCFQQVMNPLGKLQPRSEQLKYFQSFPGSWLISQKWLAQEGFRVDTIHNRNTFFWTGEGSKYLRMLDLTLHLWHSRIPFNLLACHVLQCHSEFSAGTGRRLLSMCLWIEEMQPL